MKKAPTLAEASPYKSLAEELDTLRRIFRAVGQRYLERIDTEIAGVHAQVVAAGSIALAAEKAAGQTINAAKPSVASRAKQARTLSRVHELRDMLTLLRTLQLRPAEGHRKDLKKVESVVQDLQQLSAKWG